MSNRDGGNNNGPVFSFWKVMLVALGVLAMAWVLVFVFFGTEPAP
jgi:hypothetical protein